MRARRWDAVLLGIGIGIGIVQLGGTGCSEPPRTVGQRCDYFELKCAEDLVCMAARCQTKAQVEQKLQAAFKQAQRDEKERAKRLLAQSGVTPPHHAEQPAPRAGATPPDRIRVVRTTSNSPLFASCREEERLIGGGCRALSVNAALRASYPSHHGTDDSLGGRWNCEVESRYSDRKMEAYALCQLPLPAQSSPSPPPATRRRGPRRRPPRLRQVLP